VPRGFAPVYGPGDHSLVRDSLVRYLRGKLPLAPRATAYSLSHVDDVASGHLLAMARGRPGESYVIAGPSHTFIEVFALAERVTGIPAPRLHPGRRTMRALAGLLGAIESLVPVPDAYRAESLRVIAGVTYIASSEKARRELGFHPRPLEIGLSETLLHEMQQLGIRRRR